MLLPRTAPRMLAEAVGKWVALGKPFPGFMLSAGSSKMIYAACWLAASIGDRPDAKMEWLLQARRTPTTE